MATTAVSPASPLREAAVFGATLYPCLGVHGGAGGTDCLGRTKLTPTHARAFSAGWSPPISRGWSSLWCWGSSELRPSSLPDGLGWQVLFGRPSGQCWPLVCTSCGGGCEKAATDEAPPVPFVLFSVADRRVRQREWGVFSFPGPGSMPPAAACRVPSHSATLAGSLHTPSPATALLRPRRSRTVVAAARYGRSGAYSLGRLCAGAVYSPP